MLRSRIRIQTVTTYRPKHFCISNWNICVEIYTFFNTCSCMCLFHQWVSQKYLFSEVYRAIDAILISVISLSITGESTKMLACAECLKPLPLVIGIKPSAAIHSHPGTAKSPWRREHLLNFWALQKSHGLAAAPAVIEQWFISQLPIAEQVVAWAGGRKG